METFLFIACSVLICLCALGGYLIWRLLKQMSRLEDYVIDLNERTALFKSKIDELFEMNIHYYDDIIFQFVQDTKDYKDEIDKILTEYEDLNEYLIPNREPSEQPKQYLGLVRK